MTPAAQASPLTALQAMAKVMSEVQSVSKDDQFSAGQTHYRFRGVDRVVKAISGSMRKHGLVILPQTSAVPEYIQVSTSNGKPASLARVLVTYRIYGPAGDHVEVSAPGEAMDSGDKAVSKAMSVAWRTALLQAFFLPTEDPDPDSENYEIGQAPAQQARPATRGQAAVQRLEQRDQALADWTAAVDGVVGDYDALGRLFTEARAQKAPQEILDRISTEGKKLAAQRQAQEGTATK